MQKLRLAERGGEVKQFFRPYNRCMKHLISLLAVLTFPAVIFADNWPAWRGSSGQGYCAEKNLPTKWSDKENVKWMIKLDHPGNSTPVVWGDRIFLTIANKGGSVRSLICFDRAKGDRLWKKDVEFAEKERAWTQDWYCNASPTTDGERVIVSFGSAGMYCYDLAGKELWKRTDLGQFDHMFGNGSSPILYGDLCILWCGPNQDKGRNYLLAVNKKTGKTVWDHDESCGSWSTPVIAKVNGQDQLLLAMSTDVKDRPDAETGHLKGYDPKSGKELWSCHGINSYVYTSALYSNGIAVGMSGFNGAAIAVKLGGKGDITKDRLWQHPKNIQRVGSGIIVGAHIYMVDEDGQGHCYELATGKDLWNKERVTELTWGSMVHADGKLWLLTRNGDTLILKASPNYDVIATNSLGPSETTNSSLAISNGEIFIRTNRHLWCISEKK